MSASEKINDKFNYNNIQKLNKNFMYKDLKRSNCYNSDFSGSNFNYTSFRGAHFKSCNFYGCSFKSAEFVATNFKKSKFKKAKFEDVVFDCANLDGVDFKGAEFKNTIFLCTDISKTINLNISSSDVIVFDEIPELNITENLENAIKSAMNNKFIKNSRVLDTKDGSISPISAMILLQNFDENTLIRGLNFIEANLDRDFCTLSYIIRAIENYKKEELI